MDRKEVDIEEAISVFNKLAGPGGEGWNFLSEKVFASLQIFPLRVYCQPDYVSLCHPGLNKVGLLTNGTNGQTAQNGHFDV